MEEEFSEERKFIENIICLRTKMHCFLQNEIKKRNLDITYEMIRVIRVLSREGAMNQQEIADIIVRNKASLTSLLDNMTKRNLIVRSEDPSDRRNKIISLTKLGKETEKLVVPMLNDFYRKMTTNISEEQILSINNRLESMIKNVL